MEFITHVNPSAPGVVYIRFEAYLGSLEISLNWIRYVLLMHAQLINPIMQYWRFFFININIFRQYTWKAQYSPEDNSFLFFYKYKYNSAA